MRIVVAITGASGSIYAIKLLEELKRRKHEIFLIVTKNAKKIMKYEMNYDEKNLAKFSKEIYGEDSMDSKLASGSFMYDAMVIAPCSLKSMAAIANGLALNLVARVAICCLKEGRKLIVVPRETPLDLMSLENMVKLRRAGVVVLPAMPAFYHKPKSIDDLVNYIVGKIMEQIGIEHDLYEKWRGE